MVEPSQLAGWLDDPRADYVEVEFVRVTVDREATARYGGPVGAALAGGVVPTVARIVLSSGVIAEVHKSGTAYIIATVFGDVDELPALRTDLIGQMISAKALCTWLLISGDAELMAAPYDWAVAHAEGLAYS